MATSWTSCLRCGMLARVKPFKFAPDRFEQEGWQEQLARVERWHERALRSINAGEPHAADYLYAFCQAAYHMRDWLQNSGATSQHALDDLMARTRALKHCRDVCNGSKHFVLDLRRTTTDHIGLMREYQSASGRGKASGSRPRILVFESQDGSVDLREIDELMAECVGAWREFCQQLDGRVQGLEGPE
jgi:hypothetical protein